MKRFFLGLILVTMLCTGCQYLAAPLSNPDIVLSQPVVTNLLNVVEQKEDERIAELKAEIAAVEAEIAAIASGDYQTDPEPEVPSDPAEGDIDLSQARWHGPNGANAQVVGTIENLTFDGHNFRYIQGGTSGWPSWNDNGKTLNSYACFFVFRNGQFQGGKFDGCSTSRNWRDVKNIYGKYTGGIVPNVGERVWFCLISKDGSLRTTAQSIIWKGK